MSTIAWRAGAVACTAVWLQVAQAQAPAIDNDDIGGIVTSTNGPEAGVWVIAETDAFQTRFARIVVTDDRGRYVVPDLPPAAYKLWVRGYGLADSAKVDAQVGQIVNLTAVVAPNEATAAKVYPAIYWYSMMKLPDPSELKTLPGGLDRYVASMKNLSCVGCHQLGQLATRTIPSAFGHFDSGALAWARRIQSGQAGSQMVALAAGQLGGMPFKYLGDWTDRVAAGELPQAKPARPRGVERNVVATVRDWATDHTYLHDLSGTDQAPPHRQRLRPTLRRRGAVDGRLARARSRAQHSHDDPHPRARCGYAERRTTRRPCSRPRIGARKLSGTAKPTCTTRCSTRMDAFGTRRSSRAPDNNPSFCKAGSEQPSAKLFPLTRSGRQLGVYDPKTKQYTFIDTCFSTHHLQFASRREQHALDQWRRSRRRLARHEECSSRPAMRRSRKVGPR